MKARTKAAKRDARRGRPRKDGAREPNGRPSRAKSPPDSVAVENRARRLGISAGNARDQKAGTFIGYLSMIGPRDGVSQEQYEAAQSYLRLRAAHLRAIQAPGAIYDPEAIGGAGMDPEAYAKWVRHIEGQYEDVRQQIQDAQNATRENLWAALDLVVIRGEELHHMIGATRVLCNVLARFFASGASSRRAA
jgi:hypothetical protein